MPHADSPRRLALVLALIVAAAILTAAPAATAAEQAGQAIPDQFIVTVDEGVDVGALARQYAASGAQITHIYRSAVRGFAGRMPPGAVRQAQADSRVRTFEQDRIVTTLQTQSPATWGLDRIDQRQRPLNNTYTYTATGAGVRAYIIDTGIRSTHSDFAGRTLPGASAINDGRGTNDCNGHGTHVAGTVGGSTYGVAKGVSLVGVRVLGCNGSGTISGVIAGVDWVAGQSHRPAVANMSLGGGASTALDNAVRSAIDAGITFVVAAGNDNRSACNYSPARVAQAITVGATTSSDARSSFSNYGTCVDLFAPGSSITSAWHTSNTATRTISGTSMASPHVAGVAALALQSGNVSPASVASTIVSSATTGVVSGAGSGSPNRLLYSLLSGSGGGGGTPAPVASFGASCSGTTCSFTNTSTNATSYLWNLGNGATSTAVNASASYPAGTFTVTLTATGAGGSDQASRTISCRRILWFVSCSA